MSENREYNLYKDIKLRTNGEIYLGVVGPVRTGKSTFIKQFMELMVLPKISDESRKQRAVDELPQSAQGKTIMTTEPKFIPKEAAKINISDGIECSVRLIDCVGYMVEGAKGHIENDTERMVKTPWFHQEIPFTKAAEIGTKKVINDHSTIGIVVTTDGSFGEIERANYIPPEEKTIQELKAINKPFVVILNTIKPFAADTKKLAEDMKAKYSCAVVPVNCAQLKKEDIDKVFEAALYEFPVSEIVFELPEWVKLLSCDHYIKKHLIDMAKSILSKITTIDDVRKIESIQDEYVSETRLNSAMLSDGTSVIDVKIKPEFYYQVLSEMTGLTVENEYDLISMIKDMSEKRNEYMKVSDAITDVGINGYGVVIPSKEKITLAEPVVIKNGNRYGIKIKADATAIYMIQTNIQTEIAPIVGSEQQADDLRKYISENNNVWDTNIFGKTVEQIVEDGIGEKVHNITNDSIDKLREALQKVMNENNGLVCLIV